VQIIGKTSIDFINKRYVSYLFSGILIAAGLLAIFVKGPNYGIDFTGGVLAQVSYDKEVAMNDIRGALGVYQGIELQSSGPNSVIIRGRAAEGDADQFGARVGDVLNQKLIAAKFTVDRTEYVGATVGRHLIKQAGFAIIFSFIGIIIYVAFRFRSLIWGGAGVLAIMHDVFIVFGMFCILGKEINLNIVAALLTIAGYSINDTIVIFDRIRENIRIKPKESLGNIINLSVNETLSRTIITSLTVFLVVIGLFFFGGEVIHGFALAMIIGTFIGSYSTVFVASPVIYEWEQYKLRKAKERSARRANSIKNK
jgi:preprotein translocase subunit SecF